MTLSLSVTLEKTAWQENTWQENISIRENPGHYFVTLIEKSRAKLFTKVKDVRRTNKKLDVKVWESGVWASLSQRAEWEGVCPAYTPNKG